MSHIICNAHEGNKYSYAAACHYLFRVASVVGKKLVLRIDFSPDAPLASSVDIATAELWGAPAQTVHGSQNSEIVKSSCLVSGWRLSRVVQALPI